MNRLSRTALLATGLFVAALFAGGCSSTVESSDLRRNWTPELHALSMSKEQHDNATSRRRHNNFRQIADDLAAFWLEDSNLHTTRYVIP